MNQHDQLSWLLGTPGQDAGCDEGMAVLAEYTELELTDRNPDKHFPGLAAHLHNCPACAEDHQGLLELARKPR